MKKVLIYMDEDMLKPVGGPTGYVYYIMKQMNGKRRFGDIEIDFIKKPKSFKSKIKKYVPRFIIKIKDNNRYINKIKKIFDEKPKLSVIDLKKYDIVHFHSTYALFSVRDSLKNYSGKVILTSHSPKALHKEFIEDFLTVEQINNNKDLLDKLSIMDEYAFNRADKIIFPCQDAEEPYYNSWSSYNEIHDNNEDKYFYIPTGISQSLYKKEYLEVRNEYNIPSDAFVISFVGRHNTTKGYDFLKKVGEELLNKYEDIYFLIAGKEEPLKGLDHPRWIECGWTDDAASIINSANIFILPNSETYFDIVMLEVLSLGKIVIASNTGGNKYFKKYNCNGILSYDKDNINEAIKKILSIKKLDKYQIENMEKKNKELFDKEFTIEVFFEKYIEFLNNI